MKRLNSMVVGGPAVEEYVELARQGDYRALAVLYGRCSALLAADGSLPEPLLSFMRERLATIARFLGAPNKDYSKGALAAVVGPTRRGPKGTSGGRKPKTPPLMPYTAIESQLAAEVYFLKSGDSLEERYQIVADRYNKRNSISATTVKRAFKKLRDLNHHKP